MSALAGSHDQRRPTQGIAPVLVPRIGLLGNLPMNETAQKTGFGADSALRHRFCGRVWWLTETSNGHKYQVSPFSCSMVVSITESRYGEASCACSLNEAT